jgi:hypothetical protein
MNNLEKQKANDFLADVPGGLVEMEQKEVEWWEGMKSTCLNKLQQGHSALPKFEQDYQEGITGASKRIQQWETMKGRKVESDEQITNVLEEVKAVRAA